jgi:E3 ubiquitin-protein ligase SHPRH
MLDIVAEALVRNHIRYVYCRNRAKDFGQVGPIEVFRNSADIRVLLLPLAFGAEGLDLIVASHIFLLEPLLNAQQEMQAVNRIHRIGQTKATVIHKYILINTVEERIVDFQKFQSSEQLPPTTSCSLQRGSVGLNVQKGLKRDDGSISLEDIDLLLFS